MAIEIEHKYLVIDDSYKALSDKQVEIMLEDTAKNARRIVTLGDLTPEWWI